MSAPAPFRGVYDGQTVLVTGHTGFKGVWLSLWLRRLGAKVVGYALPPDPPDFFVGTRLAQDVVHVEGDVRDGEHLAAVMAEHRPAFVFHLAAQSLVRRSYREPAATFAINVMGTVNVLEAVRATPGVRACLVVTSDKCYENREWPYAYRENDAMGGHDPYSASKGCAELVAAAYRRSFFAPDRHAEHGVGLASARAGNVVGGGDWAEDRIVPDCARALAAGQPIQVRHPQAVRPWQHVLEPLSAYLWLGAELLRDPAHFADSWNFGPDRASHVPVRTLVEGLIARWGSGRWEAPEGAAALHEAHLLQLDVSKAGRMLHWEPAFSLATTLDTVVEWYRGQHANPAFDARVVSLAQIAAYEAAARAAGLAWALGLEGAPR